MSDPDRPWNAFSSDVWRRLLGVVFLDDDFEPAEVGADAGLSPGEIAAFKAWCAHVAHEDEVRRMTRQLAPGTIRFLESLRGDLDPAERAKLDAEIDEMKRRSDAAKRR